MFAEADGGRAKTDLDIVVTKVVCESANPNNINITFPHKKD
jgi:hypothetical protein